jgi:hypothetical protein
VIVAHIMGIPIEESVLPFIGVGTSVVTALAIAARAHLSRLGRRRADPRGDD